MLLPLAVALSLTAPTASAVRADDPPVQIWIDPAGSLMQGDRVRVHVRTAQDAYVVVLRVDGDGRVRALFPLDPSDDDFARGGDKFEVRGRGDRDAFFVDERDGTGQHLRAAADEHRDEQRDEAAHDELGAEQHAPPDGRDVEHDVRRQPERQRPRGRRVARGRGQRHRGGQH